LQFSLQAASPTARSGRELYHLQFSLQAASPETFGFNLVHSITRQRRGEASAVQIKMSVIPCALTEHHAMKAYWGSGGIFTILLDYSYHFPPTTRVQAD